MEDHLNAPLDLDQLDRELFAKVPTHDALAAAEWCEERIGDFERQLAEIVAHASSERDPDRLECLKLTHALISRGRAKLFQRQGELLEQAKTHLRGHTGEQFVPPAPVESPPPPPARPVNRATRVTLRVVRDLQHPAAHAERRPLLAPRLRNGHARPRSRQRRERHVARSTSSGDSGDSGEPGLPDLARPAPGVSSCARCGARGEIRWSVAVAAWTCLRCYLRSGAGATTAKDPPPPPKRSLPPRPLWQAFRVRILDQLNRIDASRFAYIDEDRIVHICPVCQCRDGWLAIRFLGRSPRAELTCSLGCPCDAINHALRLETTP